MDPYRVRQPLACFFLALTLTVHTTMAAKGPLTGGSYPYNAQLDNNFNLKWDFNSTHILMKSTVRTTGYIGLGISANGDMYPGDIVIAWMDGDTVHFHDRHANGRVMPEIDSQQDWTLVEFKKQDGGFQTMTVSRKLNTCDEEDDIPILEGTTRVIYAYNDAVPTSEDSIPYHGANNRGSKSVLLLDPPPIDGGNSLLPNDVTTHDFVNSNYRVPSKDTTYACILTKFQPPRSGKHHLIRFAPVIQFGHDKLVHHMLLYTCSKPVPDRLLGVPYECYENEPREIGGACNFVMVAWAIGGTAFNYPEHVGHSLGTPEDPVYFKLETHYDNPGLRSDFVDHSGLRLFLTRQLRQYDAGMLEVGVQVNQLQIIPPGYNDFLSRGACTPECFDPVFGDDGIKIFADMLHSHLIGKKLQTRHIRNGTELAPISKDDNYDFDYQETRLLPQERVVKKGDMLITDCIYDSSKRSMSTFGGLKSSQEMCLSFLLYYPRNTLNMCLSSVVYQKNGEPIYEDESFLNTTDWSDEGNRDSFVKNVRESDVYFSCQYRGSPPHKQIPSGPITFTERMEENVCDPSGGTLSAGTSNHVIMLCACVIGYVMSRLH